MVMSPCHGTRKAAACLNNTLIARGHDTEGWNVVKSAVFKHPHSATKIFAFEVGLFMELYFDSRILCSSSLPAASVRSHPSQQAWVYFIECRTYEGTAAAAKEKNHHRIHDQRAFLWNEFIWNLRTHELPESSTHHHTTDMHLWKFYAQRFKCNLAVIKFA